MKPLSVSALNTQIKALMEASFVEVCVEGEISNFTHHQASGHLYFSLKDADSTIRCVMFKGNARRLDFAPKNGMQVQVSGALSVYAPRGEYQIMCQSMSQGGQGALMERFDELKKRLDSKGYFSQERKKPLPKFPRKIALLTSLTGAALQDMRRVAGARWNLTKLVAIDTLVQGEQAKHAIARNIAYADSFFGSDEAFDIIVIGRGGGSMEDLWAFNEECVADAIFHARTPIISAVGHEVDFVISDFVADMRAPTPSACMEMILPDSKEWLLKIDESLVEFDRAFARVMSRASAEVENISRLYQSISYSTRLKTSSEQIAQYRELLDSSFYNAWARKKEACDMMRARLSLDASLRARELTLHALSQELAALNPSRNIQNGYAQILYNGKPTPLNALPKDAEFELCDGKSEARAKLL